MRKFLFDLLPVILFFVAYKATGDDIFVATGVAVGTALLQMAWTKYRHGKIDRMLWVNTIIIAVLGGLTLAFHNKQFIMWKPTILYWLFAGVLLISATLFQKNLLEKMMGEQVRMPTPIWRQLNLAYVGFFVFLGALNLYVAYNFPESVWVNFKVFGTLGLLIVFVIAQSLMLARFIEDPAEDKAEATDAAPAEAAPDHDPGATPAPSATQTEQP